MDNPSEDELDEILKDLDGEDVDPEDEVDVEKNPVWIQNPGMFTVGDRKPILKIPHIVVKCAGCDELFWIATKRLTKTVPTKCQDCNPNTNILENHGRTSDVTRAPGSGTTYQ